MAGLIDIYHKSVRENTLVKLCILSLSDHGEKGCEAIRQIRQIETEHELPRSTVCVVVKRSEVDQWAGRAEEVGASRVYEDSMRAEEIRNVLTL